MKLKKYLPLIVSCAVAGVLIAVEVVLLVRFRSQYVEVKRELASAESSVDSLMKRDPFPSNRNLNVERENLEKMNEQLDAVRNWMHSNQVQYEEWSTPTEFQIKLDPNLKELQNMADRLDIALPAEFHFSFGKYFRGDMPAASDVPRLSRQLQMIKTACQLLFSHRIEALDQIERAAFDAADRSRMMPETAIAPTGRRLPGRRDEAPPPVRRGSETLDERSDDQAIFAWEDFTFRFKAREQALWNLLANLANTNLLISVEDLKFESDNRMIEELRSPEARSATRTRPTVGFEIEDLAAMERTTGRTRVAAGQRLPAKEAAPLLREERVIAGDGLLDVVMKLRMHRFLDNDDQEEMLN